jgi:hypothetical protein
MCANCTQTDEACTNVNTPAVDNGAVLPAGRHRLFGHPLAQAKVIIVDVRHGAF